MKPDFKTLDKSDLEVISKPLRKSDLEEISALLKTKRANHALATAPSKDIRPSTKR